MDEKNILISLGDKKVKEISEVIGNKTCNKILDVLTEKEATVTEIANELKMPLNTIDYNIKKLVKSGLIEKTTHWWSVKGKKMLAYKISNKKIIITPKKTITKNFLWSLGITGIAAWIIKGITKPVHYIEDKIVGEATIEATTPRIADIAFAEATNEVAKTGSLTNDVIIQTGTTIPAWGWFLIGAWSAIVLFIMITKIRTRRGK